MKKRLINSNGFTLIELIVSIAIIAIIAVSMLSLFSTGLLNISRAGSRTVNTEIASDHFLSEPVAISEEMALTIELGSPSDTVVVKGKMAKGVGTVPGSYGNVQVEIQSFVPGF